MILSEITREHVECVASLTDALTIDHVDDCEHACSVVACLLRAGY